MKRLFFLGSCVLAAGLFTGCITSTGGKFVSREMFPQTATNFTQMTGPTQITPEMLKPSTTPFTLGPGDKLELEVLGDPKSRTITTVGPDGRIYFHLLSGVDVWGLTLTETRDLLQQQLAKFLNDPKVGVALREVSSKHVWLLGRLVKPGVYPLEGPTSLLQALAQAGGSARSASQVSTEELADLRHSFLMRQGQLMPVDFYRLLKEGDTSQNVFLLPDDFVFVRSSLAQEIYVLGSVRSPRTVPYTEHMSLVSAIAGASGQATVEWLTGNSYSGTTADAYLSHVAIVRGSLSQPQIAVVDYGAIIKGNAPDIQLEPGDIVYVPNTPYATLKRYVNTIVNTFITTVAANEGIRAGGGTVNVGVSVPVGK
jgi:protein involved in polysaccharide export with SLBB domain